MSPDKMRYQANQIATFFASQPEDEQIDGVADHINKFWDPRMRAKLFEIADKSTEGFKPMLVAALAKINRPEKTVSTG
ncbi:formate dehydrogenase subunit delta [uncultured Hoeflea sp.]|uniref:formate dehydrogenase subunit delta n=1 Tax=uncultured Hoeflea sp. TaxID=538666 RepID=UPI0030EB892F|tara:strand:- start:50026 stop:50259 length:234 start_codon:yes stop_codon:yes gene_type:complete